MENHVIKTAVEAVAGSGTGAAQPTGKGATAVSGAVDDAVSVWKELEALSAAPVLRAAAALGIKTGVDSATLDALDTANVEALDAAASAAAEAAASQGASEVAGHLAREVTLAAQYGERVRFATRFPIALEATVGVGSKLDLYFLAIREAMFFLDDSRLATLLEEANGIADNDQADWDHKNRLKIYTAMYHLRCRRFEEAATLLVAALPTYNCTEAFSYSSFIRYAAIAALLTFDRVSLRKKVTNSPEVQAHINDHPAVGLLLRSLDACEYRDAMCALVDIVDALRLDPLLAPHAQYFCRELRIRLYAQKLASYRSVQLASMAADFGVSESFLDGELSRFIADGRLAARIDKVAGVVETSREQSKVVQYQRTLRESDALLNRIQKLTRVISIT
jgi:26S proteasome regulatory subunit N7